MPRIDPERLLRCLQPLLDPNTGAIRSCEEVDKILGLMSKFSKKLVSKCIYINILKATHADVLDLFMQRGGWSLIFGWTNDGVLAKNYPLLKQVLELLLLTPTTVPRLKENRFPLLIKGLSKDCENIEIKNLAKQVVSKWITVAKAEEACKTDPQQQQQQQQQLQIQQQMQLPPMVVDTGLGIPTSVSNNFISDQSVVHPDLGNLSMNSNDPLLNIDPSLIPDAENPLMDLDISHTDLANIDFNLDILDKVVDQHNLDANLGEVHSTGASSINIPIVQEEQQQLHLQPQQQLNQQPQQLHQQPQQQLHQQPQPHQLLQTAPIPITTTNMILTTNANVMTNPPITLSTITPQQQILQQQPQQTEEVYRMIQVQQVQQAPKIYIKTVRGQPTVVQSLGPEPGSFFMVIKDGKNVLMKLKEPQQTVTPIVIQSMADVQTAVTETVPGPSPVIVTKSEDTTDTKNSHRVKPPNKKEKDASSTSRGGKGKDTKVSGDSGAVKTYVSSKSKSSSDKVSGKKPSDQNAKSSHKSDKEKDKSSKDKTVANHDSHKKSKSSNPSAKEIQAAAAAKQQAEEDKLREEIRKQKSLMKKRAKEAEKQKQLEKDQETLKKLNLVPNSSTSPSSSLKIPKIPKRQTSFADAIGIPGSDGSSSASADKMKKVSPDKLASKATEDNAIPAKKFYGKKEEPEAEESEKPKERRHKPKVFVSSKSRSDDLLKEMTESSKPKNKEKEKEKEDTKPGSSLFGNSIMGTPPLSKTAKRLSTDSIEKPGDAKKAKLSGEKDKAKEKEKEKEKKKPTIALKESSLFMDMLNASSETTKPSKRKRRPSVGSEKDKGEMLSPVEKSMKVPAVKEEEEYMAETPTSEEPVKKPVFNFYRDTLNDNSDEEDKSEEVKHDSKEEKTEGGVESTEADNDSGSFTPQETDGKIKSALVLIRARNRPRKSVRWREEDELREFHYFEMDETERVNVTKQKEFTEMSQHERLHERYNMRRKPDEEAETNPWRLTLIDFTSNILQPPVNSQEKIIQEERESNILALFLPPGAPLPDTATEPDPIDAGLTCVGDRPEPRIIPVEDVNVVTRVESYVQKGWPAPRIHSVGGSSSAGGMGGYGAAQEMEDVGPNPAVNSFPPQNDFNPWNASMGFNVPPPMARVPNMGQMGDMPFPQFSMPPPGAMNMPMMNSAQPPPTAMPFGTPNPFAFPPTMMPPMNGPPDGFGGNHDGRMPMIPGRGGRFNNDTDHRRNFHGRDRDGSGRDRGGNGRDRDYRDDRGGRDRDHRRRDRDNNDRDYRHHDRDRNNRDFRPSGRNGRREIPCRFFKNGKCHLGSRCEFLHDGSANHEESRSNTQNNRSDSFDSGRSRRSPEVNNASADVDLRQTSAPPPTASFEVVEIEDWDIEQPSGNNDRFALPPSSPTEPELGSFSATESTKVIPV